PFTPLSRLSRASSLGGPRASGSSRYICCPPLRSPPPIYARTGRKLEGAPAGQRFGTVMITPADARSGKGHRDENFPVASRLIHPRHRAPILAFYEFVRTADDIADHSGLQPVEKLTL